MTHTTTYLLVALVVIGGATTLVAATDRADPAATTLQENETAVATANNLRIGNLTLDNVTVRDGVATDVLVSDADGGAVSLETGTAGEVVVTATLQNVTVERATIRNESLANQIFGSAQVGTVSNLTLSEATISNETVEAVVLRDLVVESASFANLDVTFENETAQVPDNPAAEIEGIDVERATVEQFTAINATAEQG